MIPRALIPIIAVAVVVLIAMFGFTTRGYAVHAMLVGVPVVLILASNIPLVFTLTLALLRSQLIIPGLPQGMMLFDVMVMFMTALIIGQHAITKKKVVQWGPSHRAAIFFLAVVLVTIAARGIGIRFLGSSLWGGFPYINLITYILFYLTCGHVVFQEKQMKRAMILMLLFSLIPVFAQILFFASGGAIYQQYAFVKAYATGLLGTLEGMESGGQTARLYFQGFGMSLLFFALAFFSFEGRKKLLLVLCILLALGISLLSGFRNVILGIMGTLFLFIMLTYPKKRIPVTIAVGLSFVTFLVALTPFIPSLPGGVQRSLSFVPWYDIPYEVRYEAEVSLEWRFDIWDMAWDEVPDYLVVGKGFAFNKSLLDAYTVRYNTRINAFIAHNYHSGPLSLLLDLGLAGLITGTLLLLFVVIDAYRGYEDFRNKASPFIFRLYTVLLAYMIYLVLAFYIIYGDARSTIADILFYAAVLQILRNNFIIRSNYGGPDIAPAATFNHKVMSMPLGQYKRIGK